MADESTKSFGGAWSDEKLDALRSYLQAYNQVLKNTPFKRAYIDAFAGAGTRELPPKTEDRLFDENLWKEEANYRHGSPLIALETEPGFDRFIFIERDPDSIKKLEAEVATIFPEKVDLVRYEQGDANEVLQKLSKGNWSRHRAVVFLDPFALHVEWETIEKIAQTKAIDMWLLFPAMAINRMLPRNGKIPDAWSAKLSKTFGTEDWREVFYQKQEADMFGEESVSKVPKIFELLSEFITLRLKTAFAGVNSKPLILRNSGGAPLFLLCFACGNQKGAGIALNIAQHIINKKSHGH